MDVRKRYQVVIDLSEEEYLALENEYSRDKLGPMTQDIMRGIIFGNLTPVARTVLNHLELEDEKPRKKKHHGRMPGSHVVNGEVILPSGIPSRAERAERVGKRRRRWVTDAVEKAVIGYLETRRHATYSEILNALGGPKQLTHDFLEKLVTEGKIREIAGKRLGLRNHLRYTHVDSPVWQDERVKGIVLPTPLVA